MENQYIFLFGQCKPGVKSTINFSFGNTEAFFSYNQPKLKLILEYKLFKIVIQISEKKVASFL